MRGIRGKYDQLTLLGKPFDHEDLIDYILDGLPEEYKAIVDDVNGCETPMTFVEHHEKLLNTNIEADIVYLQTGSTQYSFTANATSVKQHCNSKESKYPQ